MAEQPIPTLAFKDFLTYNEVESFCESLAAARPDLCTVTSLGNSRGGRRLLCLVVTDKSTGEAANKPGYLIHGNIHATEVAGTHTSLYTARQLLADHGKNDILQRIAFYVVPRINPDGAEQVVTSNMQVRSRTETEPKEPNTLYQQDVNGDGLVLQMRRRHPNGDMMPDPEDPRLLIPRRTASGGPYYTVYPEGMIHDWDGSERIKTHGRSYDWNRNWSYDWRPEPEQHGAGDFPFSEPEMRGLAEFLHSHPSIFGVLGYHTGPNAVLRPPSTGSCDDLDAADDQVMEDLARVAAEMTGFPVKPVVKYHTARGRDGNLRGHFHNFGYHHLGLFVYEFELGVLMNSAGIPTEEIFATRTDEEMEALMRRTMAWWDAHDQKPQVFVPWSPFAHPQLGEVELGGFINRYKSNPTMSDLEQIAKNTYRFTLNHAARHPYVVLEEIQVDRVDTETWRVRACVSNRGEFPTHVTNKGRTLRRLRPVGVAVHPSEGTVLLSEAGHRDVGHMAGRTGNAEMEWFFRAAESQKELCEIEVKGGTGGTTRYTV